MKRSIIAPARGRNVTIVSIGQLQFIYLKTLTANVYKNNMEQTIIIIPPNIIDNA
jgi:hypothetical protein